MNEKAEEGRALTVQRGSKSVFTYVQYLIFYSIYRPSPPPSSMMGVGTEKRYVRYSFLKGHILVIRWISVQRNNKISPSETNYYYQHTERKLIFLFTKSFFFHKVVIEQRKMQ